MYYIKPHHSTTRCYSLFVTFMYILCHIVSRKCKGVGFCVSLLGTFQAISFDRSTGYEYYLILNIMCCKVFKFCPSMKECPWKFTYVTFEQLLLHLCILLYQPWDKHLQRYSYSLNPSNKVNVFTRSNERWKKPCRQF